MSRLTPNIVVVDKGLNLQAPKLSAPEGTVLDSLNYEQVDFQGQKRIDGFYRYDGQLGSGLYDYTVIEFASPFGESSHVEIGDWFISNKGFYGVIVDVIEDTDVFTVYVAVYNPNNVPLVGEVGTTTGYTEVTAVYNGKDIHEPDDHYNNLLTYNNTLRDITTALPGPIAGLHWFRDRLYAVANLPVISIEGTTPPVYPMDLVSAEGLAPSEVVMSVTLDNTRLLWLNTTQDVSSLVGQPLGREYLEPHGYQYLGVIISQYEEYDKPDIASFFDSRTEQQVIDDSGDFSDIGWRHLPTGWVVHFENGNSLYGSLTAINQHPDTDGTKSSTNPDSEGKPLLLTQSVNISNLPKQVNGWKTSTFPTVYSLEVSALDDVDGYAIYADAYVSWNGTTDTVEAPGADGTGLVEYAPNAFVEVEI